MFWDSGGAQCIQNIAAHLMFHQPNLFFKRFTGFHVYIHEVKDTGFSYRAAHLTAAPHLQSVVGFQSSPHTFLTMVVTVTVSFYKSSSADVHLLRSQVRMSPLIDTFIFNSHIKGLCELGSQTSVTVEGRRSPTDSNYTGHCFATYNPSSTVAALQDTKMHFKPSFNPTLMN